MNLVYRSMDNVKNPFNPYSQSYQVHRALVASPWFWEAEQIRAQIPSHIAITHKTNNPDYLSVVTVLHCFGLTSVKN